jgi:hypothetical protein
MYQQISPEERLRRVADLLVKAVYLSAPGNQGPETLAPDEGLQTPLVLAAGACSHPIASSVIGLHAGLSDCPHDSDLIEVNRPDFCSESSRGP